MPKPRCWRSRKAAAATTACTRRARGGDRRADIQLDHAMRQALASGRFRLHYQPQVDLRQRPRGRRRGADPLARPRRWARCRPARFIPVAEESGFIVAHRRLGAGARPCARRRGWLARGLQRADRRQRLGAAVPAAAASSSAWPRCWRASELPPQLLELELTESILVRDADEALQRLHALARTRRAPVDRRLRHRLFEPGLPEALSDRQAEDRPQLRPGPARRRQRRRHRASPSCRWPARWA